MAKYTPETELIVSLMHQLAACDDCGFQVKETVRGNHLFLNISESHKDYVRFYPRLVGSGAKNFKSLEFILKVASGRNDREARLVLSPPSDRNPPIRERFMANPKWGMKAILPTARQACKVLFGKEGVFGEEPDESLVVLSTKLPPIEMYYIDSGEEVRVRQSQVVSALSSLFDSIGKSHGRQVLFTAV